MDEVMGSYSALSGCFIDASCIGFGLHCTRCFIAFASALGIIICLHYRATSVKTRASAFPREFHVHSCIEQEWWKVHPESRSFTFGKDIARSVQKRSSAAAALHAWTDLAIVTGYLILSRTIGKRSRCGNEYGYLVK